MLKIRFQRVGRKNRPQFRIVVAEKQRAAKGKFLHVLGSVDPLKKTSQLNKEQILHWLSVGAQPSQSVARFLKSAGYENMEKYIKWVTIKAPAKTEEEAAAPAPEAAPAEEAPAEATEEAAA